MEDKKNNAIEKAEEIMEKTENKERESLLKMKEKDIKFAKESEKDEKEQKKSQKKSGGRKNKGLIASVVALSIATVILASILTFNLLMPTSEEKLLENSYKKSFYDTVEQVDNIDLNLSKILVTKDEGAIQLYLVDTAINSELAENDLQELPLNDENKFYTTKLVNQIGDFSKYLNKKIVNGQEISDEDREILRELYKANAEFKRYLAKMTDEMGSNYSFLENGDNNSFIENFNELQELSVEYPELIYDGPFSDGLTKREIKGLKGEEVSENVAKEKFIEIFNDMGIEDVKSDGLIEGEIPCYNFEGVVDGNSLYGEISLKGGKLLMFAFSGSCKDVLYNQEQALQSGNSFLESLGFSDMKAVWINLSNNVYTINFAYEKENVIVYSDLVKVRVCAETNTVIGLEASSYYTNHTERNIESATISKTEAQSKVSSNINIEESRIVIIPFGESSEKLCYEFYGKAEESTYYVYIDAVTGRQIEMFKVIDSTEGMLLM